MPEPAHQRRVAAGHLHAVDAEVEIVLARRARPLGDDQRPGDQRRRLAGPAGLHRQKAEIDIAAAQDDLLARRGRDGARPHRHHGLAAAAACRALRASRRAAPAASERPASRRSRATRCGSRSMPQATRSTVPNRLTRTGILPPGVDPHSRTAPPARPRPAGGSGSRSFRETARPAPGPAPAVRRLRGAL